MTEPVGSFAARRYALSIGAAVVWLAGCSGSQPPLGAPGATPQAPANAAQADRRPSWMRADAKRHKRLLYISDQESNTVFVYDYRSGVELGQLTGLDEPSTLCVDARGDIYIPNAGSGITEEFAHGGTRPIATFNSEGYASGCSVDAAGDLAVTNTDTPISGGNIYVWTGGKGLPKKYHDDKLCYYLWPAGYDDAGNLIVQGTFTHSGAVNICGVLKGSQRMTELSFDGSIQYAGATMWDGKHIALDVQGQTRIIRASLRDHKLIERGEVVLEGNCDQEYLNIVQPFVVGEKNTPVNDKQGREIVGGNLLCTGEFDFWKYPAGGAPQSELSSAPASPIGEAVSIGP
jgi:hypothetical protein